MAILTERDSRFRPSARCPHALLSASLLAVACWSGQVSAQDLEALRPPLALQSNVVPEYPPPWADAGLEEDVTVYLRVLADGSVDRTSMRVVAGRGLLETETLAELASWRFEPAGAAGRPVAAPVTVRVRYTWRDTVRAVPGDVMTLADAQWETGDSPNITVISPLRVPSYGLSPKSGEEIAAPVRDSMVMAALLAALPQDAAHCLRRGEASSWVEQRLHAARPGIRQPPDCDPHAPGLFLWIGDVRPFEDGLVRVPITEWTVDDNNCPRTSPTCGSGTTGGWQCDALRRNGKWLAYCLTSPRGRWLG